MELRIRSRNYYNGPRCLVVRLVWNWAGHLAARVLKKPNLDGCGLVELASEVGVYYEEQKSITFSNWGARVFSHEQVKYAIRDAYASYLIANNLLSLL